jgi:hypothetical protein
LAKGLKATKVDLKCDASTLALNETVKMMMTEKEEALAKMDEKWCHEKEATCPIFIAPTKRAMEIQTIDAKFLTEENRVMLTELSLREPEQRVWFEKKQAD